jgi:hypothetical protein
MKIHLLAIFAAAIAWAAPQQFRLNLDSIAARASDAVDLSLSGATLKFAAKFLDSHDAEEAQVKKLIEGLQGIYIKHFQFKKGNAWSEADLDPVRNQLHTPGWERIVGVKESEGSSTSEIYLRLDGGKTTGVAIITCQPTEVTVINIVGTIDLDQLAQLGGHFDIPKLNIPKNSKGK